MPRPRKTRSNSPEGFERHVATEEVENDQTCDNTASDSQGDDISAVMLWRLGHRTFRPPNVSPLSSGRIRKCRGIRRRRASPWYVTTGERLEQAGHDEARPSASTACWAAHR
jgi:hypothetical protein